MTQSRLTERQENLAAFRKGLPHGIPIGLGYFAVAFALGITARDIGMSAVQAFVMSAGMMASAGEYAALDLLSSGAGFFEIVMTCIVVNLRYFLMGCALTQKLPAKKRKRTVFAIPYCVTDEIFGVSVSVEGTLNPF
ncbi:MAG: AzlC family ABC transporter permease, partial [Oscillospiraceae bacterium]|nr:AzlC family ABC transporter permease [Oscillospiraceae bacterium]